MQHDDLHDRITSLEAQLEQQRCEIDAQRRNTRRAALLAITAACVALPLASRAVGFVKTDFMSGQPILAAEINTNFANLLSAVKDLEDDVADLETEVGQGNATFYGSLTYPATADCDWRSSATSGSGMAADADCAVPIVIGSVTAPIAKIPGLVLTGAGRYLVLMQGGLWGSNSMDGGRTSFWLSDGTVRSSAASTPVSNGSGYSTTMPTSTSFIVELTDSAPHPLSIYVDTSATTYVELANHDAVLEHSGLNFQVFRFPLD